VTGRVARTVAAGVLAAALAGCGSDDEAPAAGDTAPTAGLSGSITVLAAASLSGTFAELGERFEAANPGTTVRFSFAASSELATQVAQGAPADVLATASLATMAQVSEAGRTAGEPEVFARNALEIAVPAGNPAGVTGLEDFADEDLTIALCAPEVPCGGAAEAVFDAAGITPAPDTLEPDVKATLSKVTLGEVDAALVYRTDVLAADEDVEGIELPEAGGAVNDYPIAVLADAGEPEVAQEFVELVRSTEGAAVLSAAGFGVP
jgi:molybdate transport system substrate-binding protein